MTSQDRESLCDLRDREAVREVILRYASAVDRRDLPQVAACFTPDAAYDGALARGDVRAALAALAQSLERYQSTMHFVGNQLVGLNGDRATCETYAVAYHRFARGDVKYDRVVAVRYEDELVRDGTSWRICRRAARALWTRDDPVVAPAPSARSER